MFPVDILSIGDIEDDRVSHFILQYDVETFGDHRYRSKTSNFVSESTLDQVRLKIREVDLKERIQSLG